MRYTKFKTEIYNFISEHLERYNMPLELADEQEYIINGVSEKLCLRPTNANQKGRETVGGSEYSELFLQYNMGMSLELIANKFILDSSRDSNLADESEADFSAYRNRIGAALINRKNNMEYLRTMPYRPFLDLAVIYRIMLKNGDKIESTAVTNDIMRKLQLCENDLYENSLEYMKKTFPTKAVKAGNVCRLTNLPGIFGASSLLDKEMLQKLANEYAGDLIVIPTDIHEVHILPKKHVNVEKIRGVIMRLKDITEPENFLSDNYYVYDADYKQLELVLCDLI